MGRQPGKALSTRDGQREKVLALRRHYSGRGEPHAGGSSGLRKPAGKGN